MSEFFRLFANCIPVKGSEESIIIDLQNNEYIDIPNLLFDVLEINHDRTVENTKSFFNNELDEGIDNYFNNFMEVEYGFFLKNVQSFPPLSLEWFSPLEVNNAILEINENCKYDYISAIKELSSLGCSSLQLRISKINIKECIFEILEATRKSRIRSIEMILPEYLFDFSFCEYLEDIENRISLFIIHSIADENRVMELYGKSKFHEQKRLLFTPKIIDTLTSDKRTKENFVINVDFFCESQKFNVALNRKVCIDNGGYYKNFLSHKDVHGNFNTKSIKEIINDKEFTRKWFINNDNIDICKDCQFRYICLDNTDIEFDGRSWHKIENCGFDPYKNEWNAS